MAALEVTCMPCLRMCCLTPLALVTAPAAYLLTITMTPLASVTAPAAAASHLTYQRSIWPYAPARCSWTGLVTATPASTRLCVSNLVHMCKSHHPTACGLVPCAACCCAAGAISISDHLLCHDMCGRVLQGPCLQLFRSVLHHTSNGRSMHRCLGAERCSLAGCTWGCCLHVRHITPRSGCMD